MPILHIETQIDAPAEVCFELMRDHRLHDGNMMILSGSDDRGSAGVSMGQMVAFDSTFLGLKQRLVVRVTECQRPHRFVDQMVEGTFRTFIHIHEFTEKNGITVIRDILNWTSPFGLIGRVADELLIKRRLERVVKRRNAALRQIAEQQAAGDVSSK